MTTKHDDASWHYEGDFPSDLPEEAGGTHIGFFMAWIIHRGLEGEELKYQSTDSLEAVRKRRITGRDFLFKEQDGRLIDEDLSEEVNSFATFYLGTDGGDDLYASDYEKVLVGELPSIYHVEDTWENYQKIEPVLDKRFGEWKKRNG